jgi:tetratricopeptide (TPR) repeat protein
MCRPACRKSIPFIATFYFLSLAGALGQDWGAMLSKGAQQTGKDSRKTPSSFLISVRDSGGLPIFGAVATIGQLWVEKSDHDGIVRVESRAGMRYPISIVVSARGYQTRQLLLTGARLEDLEVHLPRLESNTPERTVSVTELLPENQATSAGLQQKSIQALQRTDYSRAEQLLRKAIELTPSVGMLHNNLGVAVLRQGRMHEAVTWFERAHELAPYDPGTNGNLGVLYWMQGRRDESYRLLDRAVELGFSTQSAHYYLGILALERRQWKLSAEQLSRINGDRFRYRDLFLSLALRGKGREKEALKSFQKHISKNPVHYYVYIPRHTQTTAVVSSQQTPQ